MNGSGVKDVLRSSVDLPFEDVIWIVTKLESSNRGQ